MTRARKAWGGSAAAPGHVATAQMLRTVFGQAMLPAAGPFHAQQTSPMTAHGWTEPQAGREVALSTVRIRRGDSLYVWSAWIHLVRTV